MSTTPRVAEAVFAFQAVTELSAREVKAKARSTGVRPDFVLRAGGQDFIFQMKGNSEVATVARALDQLGECLAQFRSATPVLVVPYMGEAGQALCRDAHVSWMDLSGNAHIVAAPLRVIIRGMPNRYVRRGRPRSVFAPKSARVTRFLLLHPSEAFTQSELARRTHLTEGFISRVVRALEADGLLVRDDHGAVKPRDVSLLLDAWREAYEFAKHQIHRVHVVARNGEGATVAIAHALQASQMEHAATGLSAAWLWAPFAAFRTATFYVERFDLKPLSELGARKVESGENVWLVEPNDAGVYEGCATRNGVRCVSAIQTYMDLKGHRERAAEAAAELRRRMNAGER